MHTVHGGNPSGHGKGIHIHRLMQAHACNVERAQTALPCIKHVALAAVHDAGNESGPCIGGHGGLEHAAIGAKGARGAA